VSQEASSDQQPIHPLLDPKNLRASKAMPDAFGGFPARRMDGL